MKRALVCGAGGFIGGHLVNKLKREGYWVRGVDIKHHEFVPPPVPPNVGGPGGQADEFLLLDLREPENCRAALTLPAPLAPHPPKVGGKGGQGVEGGTFDEVYQLAADMGGMGFISVAECEVLRNNALINIHMTHTAAEMGMPRCGAEERRGRGAVGGLFRRRAGSRVRFPQSSQAGWAAQN